MTLAQPKQTTAHREFAEFIISMPALEQIAAFRLSDTTEAHINGLQDANNAGTITEAERAELEDYLRLEHLMRLVKLEAYKKLDQA